MIPQFSQNMIQGTVGIIHGIFGRFIIIIIYFTYFILTFEQNNQFFNFPLEKLYIRKYCIKPEPEEKLQNHCKT